MRYAPELHMFVMLLDHGNAGAQVPCQGVHSHPVVGQCHGGVVVPQSVHGVPADPDRRAKRDQ